jgi:hypothetical protein
VAAQVNEKQRDRVSGVTGPGGDDGEISGQAVRRGDFHAVQPAAGGGEADGLGRQGAEPLGHRQRADGFATDQSGKPGRFLRRRSGLQQ